MSDEQTEIDRHAGTYIHHHVDAFTRSHKKCIETEPFNLFNSNISNSYVELYQIEHVL